MCCCAAIAVVDPNQSGRYPVCPTRALFGIDCPACGTLRGLHALSRGNLVDALGHNLLLLAAVPMGVAIVLHWVATALGRPMRRLVVPRGALVAAIAVATAYAVARNLPVDSLRWLDSA